MAGSGCTLDIQVIPAASRDQVVGVREGLLCLRVKAPAREGKANAAVIALLAHALKVPKSQLAITGGHTSRRKVVAVQGLDRLHVEQRLGLGLSG